jgi:WD40 repeat protein
MRFELTRDERLLAHDSRDGSAAFAAAAGHLLRLEDVGDPSSVTVSRDGRRAVARVAPALESSAVQLWDLDNRRQPRIIDLADPVSDVTLSADGAWIAVAGGDILLARWPGTQPRALGATGVHRFSVAAFAPDSRQLAAAAYDGKTTTIFVWDLPADGSSADTARTAPTRTLTALGYTGSLAFSDDGERLVAAQSDGSLRIWELNREEKPLVLRGHSDPVNSAAFSPDGTEVVSGGSNGTVRVWRLEQGAKSVALPGPRYIVSVAFTADGRHVVAVGTRGARTWRCDFCGTTDAVLATARRRATRTLTPEERSLYLHER